MGCDIHIYVEKKTSKAWEAISGPNPYIADYEMYEKRALEREDVSKAQNYRDEVSRMKQKEPVVMEGWIYNGRNYNLFSILAGVRNTYEVIPIAPPRGMPLEASGTVRNEHEGWGLDAHSCSYFTFAEILKFDWENRGLENEGYVDEETYKKFLETGDPYPCCSGVGGGNIEKVLNSEMNRIIKEKYPWENDKNFYTAIKWTRKYSEIASEILNNIKKTVAENNIDDLDSYRIVFWFDN